MLRPMHAFLILGIFAVCGPTGLFAQIAYGADKTVELFNGKDLTGWKVITCQAEVQDGAIFLKEGNGLVQSERQYGDFILELDWKALKPDKWDSGIYFRYDSIPTTRPWPARYQANLRKGQEGNVGGLKGAESTGLVKDGDWNHMRLTVRGTTATMELNGKPAWQAEGLECLRGYIGLQSEVAGGGQFLFRNISITELEKTP